MPAKTQQVYQSPIINSIEYALITHIGQRREENQDSFVAACGETSALFVVADGMGGASGGALASAITSRVLSSIFEAEGVADSDQLREAILEANKEIFLYGRRSPILEGMGTTVSGFLLTKEAILICNVGDSRVYRFRENSIAQLTDDHTLVGELLASGALTPEQADQSPVSHMLTRSVGPSPEVEVDCFYLDEPPLRGDIYLVCSDGLYNSISSAEIGYVIGEYRLHDALEHLVALANMRGGADNITGILVECTQGYPEHAAPSSLTASSKSKSDRKNMVAVDLAEAAASDTFSRIKKEVDISAEILWGAHTTKTVKSLEKREEKTKVARRMLPAPVKFSLIQRAILVCAAVFFATLAWAFWVHSQRLVNDERPFSSRPKNEKILDFSDHAAEVGEQDPASLQTGSASARRNDLLSRLSSDVVAIPEEERLSRRFKRLIDSRQHYDLQKTHISLPPDPALIEYQRKLERDRAMLRDRLQEVEKEIDRIGVSLNRWQQRLGQIDEIDTVNLSSELAPLSPELDAKKEMFEKATWRYLKRLGDQKFDPANTEIQHSVDQLVRERNERLEDLRKTARGVIETAIGKDSRQRGLLLIEKDEIIQDEKAILANMEYVAARLSGDLDRQIEFTDDLEARSTQVAKEIEELERLGIE